MKKEFENRKYMIRSILDIRPIGVDEIYQLGKFACSKQDVQKALNSLVSTKIVKKIGSFESEKYYIPLNSLGIDLPKKIYKKDNESNKNVKVWVITDTHFGHSKLIEYGRPDNFEEQISKNLMSKIDVDDILIHLGDFCFGEDLAWNYWMKNYVFGKHFLVKGNHDNKSNVWYLKNGWDFVCYYFSDSYFGKKILFSHMPLPKMHGVDINIHGHWHDNDHRKIESIDFYDENYHKLLAIEHTNYQPVLLKDFIT